MGGLAVRAWLVGRRHRGRALGFVLLKPEPAVGILYPPEDPDYVAAGVAQDLEHAAVAVDGLAPRDDGASRPRSEDAALGEFAYSRRRDADVGHAARVDALVRGRSKGRIACELPLAFQQVLIGDLALEDDEDDSSCLIDAVRGRYVLSCYSSPSQRCASSTVEKILMFSPR